MTRTRAALIHLGISSVLAMGVIALLVFGWYPWPYFLALGGLMLVTLIVGVDVVLGPLLTFIVFKSGKKSLKFDLTAIALIQAAALGYGLWAGYTSRVVYGVFVENKFHLVQANEVEESELAKATREEFRTLPLFGPKYIAARAPASFTNSLENMLIQASGLGIQNMPQYYLPMNEAMEAIKQHDLDGKKLARENPALQDRIRLIETSQNKTLLTLPIHTRNGNDLILVIVPSEGKVVDVLRLPART